jgi:hypothetical protein
MGSFAAMVPRVLSAFTEKDSPTDSDSRQPSRVSTSSRDDTSNDDQHRHYDRRTVLRAGTATVIGSAGLLTLSDTGRGARTVSEGPGYDVWTVSG